MSGNTMLPLLAQYTCPGDPQPISESLHQARLRAGWSGCRECRWNETVSQSGSTPAVGPSPVIRRTKNGVRGQWLNAIDRIRGARLACLFGEQFRRLKEAATEQSGTVVPTAPTTIALGFDEHRGCTEIFAAALTAVHQCGINVVDAGRCTAASLLHVCETFPDVDGAILVTGLAGQPGETGMDAFLPDGGALSVPWQDLGVKTQSTSRFTTSQSEVTAWKQRLTPPGHIAASHPHNDEELQLQLPADLEITRGGRSAGQHHTTNAEDSYRTHLLHWWPQKEQQGNALFVATGDLTNLRLAWLARTTEQNIRTTPSLPEDDQLRQAHVSFVVDSDDRHLEVINSAGRILTAQQVSAWINDSVRTGNRHVTSHVSPVGELVLVDVATPGSPRPHRFITDALATAGFIQTLLSHDRNRLPN